MSKIAQKTADTNDGAVTYRELGSGAPLVLLHGIGSGSESWRAQLLDFGKLYHVIAWDAPGYGGSTPVAPSTPSAADYARRLETFLDALGVATCHLVGHSLGAIMACRFARDKSERVKSLITLGTPHHGTPIAALGIGLMLGGILSRSPMQMTPKSRFLGTTI